MACSAGSCSSVRRRAPDVARTRSAGFLAVSLVVSLFVAAGSGAARAADGDLDPTFGGDGKVVTDFGFADRADGVAVQPDGRIVIAGTSCNGDFLVARYLSDGTLDPSFGRDGSVCVDVAGGSSDQAESVFVLGDGRLLVAGTSGGDFALARLDPDGSLDPTFGTGGRATYDLPGAAILHDAALAPDGKVVMVGETVLPGCASAGPTRGETTGVAAVRVTADGAHDPTFGSNGVSLRADPNSVQRGLAVAVQPDGRVVVAGRTSSCTRVSIDTLVFRLTASGAPDATFSAVPPVTDPTADSAVDVALQPDGKILVLIDTFAGPATLAVHDDAFIVARYNPDGSLDSTFGSGGVALASFGAGRVATPAALTLHGDKMVAGGSVDGDFAVARWNPDGTLDTSFDGDGMVVTDMGGDDAIAALAVQPDGKLVAAGRSGADVALARYGTAASTTTSTTTSTSMSTVPTTSTTATAPPSAQSAACSAVREIEAMFRANPVLQRFVAVIERATRSFCPT